MTDSYLRCGEHSKVMELLGEIHGRLAEMAERQISMLEKIEQLTECGQKRKIENAITSTKLTPLFWVIGIAVAGIVAAIINHLAKGH